MNIEKMMNEEIKTGYTRISDILKPFTKFDKIDPIVLANAADRGSRVHEYCNAYANNIFLADIDEDCQGYVNSFIEWYDDNVVKLLYSEQRLYDDIDMFTGKFDMIVRLKSNDDQITLLDIKTPLMVSRAWGMQLSAYKYLVENQMKISVDNRIIIQLPKDGKKAKKIDYKDDEKDIKLFFSALELHNHFNQK